MGKIQREIYDYISEQYVNYFEQENVLSNLRSNLTRARLIRLMQVSTNPGLLKNPLDDYLIDEGVSSDLFVNDAEVINKILRYNELEIPNKFKVAYNLVKEIISKGEKVIVWAIFIQTIKEFQSYLENLGISSKLLIGETPVESNDMLKDVETREKIIINFHDQNCPFKVIIANPFAVAESISLHKACHNAIYLERNFNAATFIQSKDRIHRIGLKIEDKINYYYILSENSVDETIHDRLIEKERRMLGIIEREPIPLLNLNMDYEEDQTNDIKAIIRDYVRRYNKI